MKTTITICLLLLACFCHEATHCQPAYEPIKLDTVTTPDRFIRVFEVPGMGKDDLYRIVKKWAALSYRSAQNVIQLDDMASGEFIVKGISPSVKSHYALGEALTSKIRHVLSIQIKEGKVRVSLMFTHLIYSATSGSSIGGTYIAGRSGGEDSMNFCLTKYRKKDRALLKKGLVQEANDVFESILKALYSKESSDW